VASTSAQFSLVLRVRIAHRPGMLGRVATAIGEAGGTIGSVDLISLDDQHLLRDIIVDAAVRGARQAIADAVDAVEGAEVVDRTDRTFLMHLGGKIEQRNKQPLRSRDDLSMAYTPGVAASAARSRQDRDKAFQYTIKRNTVAVVSDGSAVLGLGDIGPRPRCRDGGQGDALQGVRRRRRVPAVPGHQGPDEIVATVKAIAPRFGGINLEDISRPRCFEIEERLKAALDIPVFHDDQHGTAVVVLAALLNATSCSASAPRTCTCSSSASARRDRDAKILLAAGVTHVIGCDSRGALHTDRADYRDGSMTAVKRWFAESTNPERRAGGPADVIDGADLFVGLSGARVMPAEALARMNRDAMVFAMANPNPEVTPEEAAPYARIIATGPLGLPEPDQQRALLPRHLPRRAGRARARDHRGDEDGRRPRDRRDRRRRRAARGLHHPVGVQPRRGRLRRRRGRRRGQAPGDGGGRRGRDRLRRRGRREAARRAMNPPTGAPVPTP
jgi:malate dehydrogenase (oxaloacetate-decarboxylating)